jgi:hypothetical protein
MSYTYLLDAEEESSAESFSDIARSAPWKSRNTAANSCCNGNAMESCHGSQSGTMCKPSTEGHGLERSMSSAAASPAKTYHAPEKAPELTASEAACGAKWPASFARWNPDSSSWKTHQCSLFGGWEDYSETWPEWGIMLHGECWAAKPLEQANNAEGYGYWPAMTCNGWRAEGSIRQLRKLVEMGITTEAEASAMGGGSLRPERMERWEREPEEATGGRMNPAWGEWLMGWPIGWTDKTPLETDRFRQWLQKHGVNSPQN